MRKLFYCAKLFNHIPLWLIATKWSNSGWSEWSKKQDYCMRKNGALLRTQSVIHNAIWPSLTPNRKYLSMCVFRELSSLWRERSGKYKWQYVWHPSLSHPCFSTILSLAVFFQLPWRLSVHPGRAFTHTITVCLLRFCAGCILDFFRVKVPNLWSCSRRHILSAAFLAWL